MTATAQPTAMPVRRIILVLCGGFFLLDFDMAVVNPLLVPISKSLHTGVGTAALALTGYLLMLGVMQPVHGVLSDRYGRIGVLCTALCAIGAADLLSALSPNLGVLVAARAIAGAFAAAIIPVTVAYVGDLIAPAQRQRAMAALLSASAIGAAVATIAAGVLAKLVDWRLPLALPAVGAPLLALVYWRLPRAPVLGGDRRDMRDRFAAVLAQGWFRFLIPFTFVEGAVMVGLYNFFGAAMQKHGSGVLLSGLVTSAYGLAAVGGGALVGRLEGRMSGAAMFGWGTALLGVGYLCAARTQSVAGILVAGVLAGLALVVGQSSLQAWVLEAATPETRGSATALIACSVFTGASLSTAAVRPLANSGDFTWLFGLAAALTVPVCVLGTLVRARFQRATAAHAGPQAQGPRLDKGPAQPASASPHDHSARTHDKHS